MILNHHDRLQIRSCNEIDFDSNELIDRTREHFKRSRYNPAAYDQRRVKQKCE